MLVSTLGDKNVLIDNIIQNSNYNSQNLSVTPQSASEVSSNLSEAPQNVSEAPQEDEDKAASNLNLFLFLGVTITGIALFFLSKKSSEASETVSGASETQKSHRMCTFDCQHGLSEWVCRKAMQRE